MDRNCRDFKGFREDRPSDATTVAVVTGEVSHLLLFQTPRLGRQKFGRASRVIFINRAGQNKVLGLKEYLQLFQIL